jgi:protein-S-isoprenylcysteine O-methyltransferase Ste14
VPELVAEALWSSPAVKGAGVGRQLGYRFIVLVGVVLLFGFYHHDASSEIVVWRTTDRAAWALDAVVAAGFAFTWWARVHLGRLWSSRVTRKEGHHVVDTGPYALVRHPIYSGIILASIATATLRGTAAAGAGAARLSYGWYVKARIEERFLRSELGPAYDDYAKRVPMLIPFA